MTRTILPADPVERALTFTTLAGSMANGVFYGVSALYFTRVIGLSAASVGVGLTIAGAAGVVASYAGGRLSDLVGADRVLRWASVAQALALLAYVAAAGWSSFVAIACAAVGFRSLQGSAKSALLARWFTGPDRVAVRARLRVVMNVSIGLGTLAAGLALLVDTRAAYQAAMVVVGLLALLSVLPVLGLRERVPGLAEAIGVRTPGTPAAVRGRSPFRDPTYLSVSALNAVIAMQFGMQSVGVPLWIAGHTDAPAVMISVLLVLNTVLVASLQVRAARGTDDVLVAGRTVRRAGGALAVGCLLYGAAGSLGALAAVLVLLVAEVVATLGEIWAEAGAWGLAFELADPASVGAYQGVSQMGYAIAGMLAPLVVTATAIDHGLLGWAALGCVFTVAGIAVAAIARHASARALSSPAAISACRSTQ
ncbi:MFS transporter [Nocardioides lianchengensis]|uniref:Major Facilitator Superfamily protein n=1 Tax=Nocardioides lianchengensis TaxID=1045774 RepID=A0A1G6V7B5_9ACTN|nr:MFS transporter [Nocardioides lianchengensis]NYG11166.1 MFS family permease [Nocardioides lianchengensis]SDD49421.1 Major Facilitator Superfamily protein [Nocardioides lianchengensis]